MNTLKKRKSGKKGFTLMEMLIVVAIIGILVAIMIPTFSNALTKARIATDEANLRSYYSECMVNYMMNDTALPKDGDGDGQNISVDGVTYKLQAGTYAITGNADGKSESFKIEYTINKGSQNGTKVTIPGESADSVE